MKNQANGSEVGHIEPPVEMSGEPGNIAAVTSHEGSDSTCTISDW